MHDGLFRRAIKALARVVYLADVGLSRLGLRARGQLPYRLAGACDACGRCCVEPSIRIPWLFERLSSLRWLVLAWHRDINGFEYLRTLRAPTTWVFRCTHYDPATRRCDSYASRPGMCRDYPRLLLHAPIPELLDGCGHRAVHQRADQVKELLTGADLPAETRVELERKLNLEERTRRRD